MNDKAISNQSPLKPEMYLQNAKKDERVTGPDSMGKDAFMKILIAQLQNQDPTNPMKDNELIAQMAQFTALEQTMKLANAFEKFAEAQNETQLIQYNQFIGKEIVWHNITEEEDEEGTPIIEKGRNTIDSIQFEDGNVKFTLDNGKEIYPANISEIVGGGSLGGSNHLVTASLLIGRTVTYKQDDLEETSTVESVKTKNGQVIYVLANGKEIDDHEFTSIQK